MKAGVEKVRHSVLNLVDLAGSERQKDSKAVGQRLKVRTHLKGQRLTEGMQCNGFASMFICNALYLIMYL